MIGGRVVEYAGETLILESYGHRLKPSYYLLTGTLMSLLTSVSCGFLICKMKITVTSLQPPRVCCEG